MATWWPIFATGAICLIALTNFYYTVRFSEQCANEDAHKALLEQGINFDGADSEQLKEIISKLRTIEQSLEHQSKDSTLNSIESLLKELKERQLQFEAQQEHLLAVRSVQNSNPDAKAVDNSNKKGQNNGNDLYINDNRDNDQNTVKGLFSGSNVGVLIIACDRESAVRKTLDSILKLKPDNLKVVVSLDCGNEVVARAVQEYEARGVSLVKQPDLGQPPIEPGHGNFVGYYKIARHYKFALSQAFDEFKFSHVIIVEDDLNLSPDIFEYFSAGLELLKKDPTLWCVSAWNDNGLPDLIQDHERLYRSDFFGGLGWMISASLWHNELKSRWPRSFWDDWIRKPEVRRERACIRPEYPRTTTFGRIGVSNGQFFDKHLGRMRLNDVSVPFSRKDLSYLLKQNYDPTFEAEVYGAQTLMVSALEFMDASDVSKIYRIEYRDKFNFERVANTLGLMDDLKAGVPRMGYRGVVSVVHKGKRVHVAPSQPWAGYRDE